MPKLMGDEDKMQVMKVAGAGAFQFSAIKPANLGASEYTLVTIACDVSGSVETFRKELLEAVKAVVRACQKNPRSENLMLRLVSFNHNLMEVHGFLPLNSINPDDYKDLDCDGSTALYDAVFSSVGATTTYSESLIAQDYNVNGAIYIITDGMDNASGETRKRIKEQIAKSKKAEVIESLITVLVGVNTGDGQCKDYLEKFKDEAGLTQFVDIGDATPQRLAKLGGWVSKSISSQSQALGTGGPSQSLTF